MDLKIELSKLFALHEASLRLQHGVRESEGLEWIEFAPTNFVYAFFTFNSIYSFDNQLLFEILKHKDIGWVTPKVNFSSNPSSSAFGHNHDVM